MGCASLHPSYAAAGSLLADRSGFDYAAAGHLLADGSGFDGMATRARNMRNRWGPAPYHAWRDASGRAEERNDLPCVAPVVLEIGIEREDPAVCVSLAQPDQAGIGQGHGGVLVSP